MTESVRHILRGILIIIVQVLILKRIGSGSQWIWQHGAIFLYPIIILILPIRMSRHYVTLIGFAIGMLIDLFYDTMGIHAFTLTAMAYSRGILLAYLEPRGGYTMAMSPTRHSMGINWLLIYSSLLILVHVFVYYVIEVFTFVYIGQILLKTTITFVMTMLVILGYHLLFNPRK
ncbi:MAG: hypothetical protein M3R25_02635 [Bacteroidota bacterium]|nr:hypothetical protein [Bacteroidota bacterium]